MCFFGGERGKTKKHIGKEMVSWLPFDEESKNYGDTRRSKEDERNILSLVGLQENDFSSKLATFEGGIKNRFWWS